MSSGILKINVGGHKLHVRHSTLAFIHTSTLAALPKHANDNQVFVDRPQRSFLYVIDWCRTMGQLPLPASRQQLTELRAEADYWLLLDLRHACDQMIQATTPAMSPPFDPQDTHRASQWMQARPYMHMRPVQAQGLIVIVATPWP